MQTSFVALQAPGFRLGPHPRDYVMIVEGHPFVVPDGAFFVPTAIGGTGSYPSAGFNLTAD